MAYSQEHQSVTTERPLSRRSLLTLGALAVATGFVPLPVLASVRQATDAIQARHKEPQTRERRTETAAQVPRGNRQGHGSRGNTLARGRREPQGRGRRTETVAHVRGEESSVRVRSRERSSYARREERSVYARRGESRAYMHYEEPPVYLHSAAKPEKALAIYNPHTGESIKTVYWFRGKYLSGALRDIDYLLRDYRANEVKSIDPQLLDVLYSMSAMLETDDPFYVISGYRSPSTNALLRLFNAGVAENSLHIEGKAVDIRLPGRDASYIRQAAVALQAGGVGYYPYANFVHVDTGPVRYW